MLEHRILFALIVVLTVCIWIWRISIHEPSIMAIEVDFLKQYQSQAQYQSHQQDQQEQLSKPYSKVNNKHRADYGFSGFYHSKKLNSPNENITSPTNSINSSNYLTDSYLSNRNYKDRKEDINNLIDLHNFEFVINQKSCLVKSASLLPSFPGILDVLPSSLNVNTRDEKNTNNYHYPKQNTDRASPLLLILVHSAPGNFNKRLQIRDTWGSVAYTVTNNVRLMFLLGVVTKTRLQHSLENENKMYSDIVQGNFIDNYRNMTYKHIMALKWFTYYCPDAKYILKTDDDIFVHTPNLIDYLSTVAERRNLLFCWKHNQEQVIRTNTSKWFVSEQEYSGDYYPPYCRGFAIVYSPDVAFRIYLEAQKTRYFWLDDVHVTGTLRQRSNITIKSIEPVMLQRNKLEDILNGKIDIDAIPFLFVWHRITDEEIKKLWELLKK